MKFDPSLQHRHPASLGCSAPEPNGPWVLRIQPVVKRRLAVRADTGGGFPPGLPSAPNSLRTFSTLSCPYATTSARG